MPKSLAIQLDSAIVSRDDKDHIDCIDTLQFSEDDLSCACLAIIIPSLNDQSVR